MKLSFIWEDGDFNSINFWTCRAKYKIDKDKSSPYARSRMDKHAP